MVDFTDIDREEMLKLAFNTPLMCSQCAFYNPKHSCYIVDVTYNGDVKSWCCNNFLPRVERSDKDITQD